LRKFAQVAEGVLRSLTTFDLVQLPGMTRLDIRVINILMATATSGVAYVLRPPGCGIFSCRSRWPVRSRWSLWPFRSRWPGWSSLTLRTLRAGTSVKKQLQPSCNN
jgi:hypothetical protein